MAKITEEIEREKEMQEWANSPPSNWFLVRVESKIYICPLSISVLGSLDKKGEKDATFFQVKEGIFHYVV
jgi:hypothetical protein